MKRPPAFGEDSLAAIGVVACFVIAGFFSGCNLDDAVSVLTGEGCPFYPPCPGVYRIIYKDPNDGKLKSLTTFPSDRPFIIYDPLQPANHIYCDGIDSYSKVGEKCPE